MAVNSKVIPSKLFSLTLELQAAATPETRVRVVVPYLEAGPGPSGEASASISAASAFPYSSLVPLDLPLGAPAAAWFTVNGTFTTAEGVSQTTPLEPLFVEFEDLLVPGVPVDAPPAAVWRRFRQLWSLLGRRAQSDDTDGGSDDGSDPPAALDAAAASEVAAVIADAGNGTVVDAYESVKHVALAAVDMRRLVTRHFGSFRLAEVPSAPAAPAPASAVPLPASPARSTQFLWALLPPRHILLVRLVMAPDATVVTFRSDSWRPHAYVDALMDRLVAEAEQADPVRDA